MVAPLEFPLPHYLARKVQDISSTEPRQQSRHTLSTQKTWKDICASEVADEAIVKKSSIHRTTRNKEHENSQPDSEENTQEKEGRIFELQSVVSAESRIHFSFGCADIRIFFVDTVRMGVCIHNMYGHRQTPKENRK